MILHFSMAFHIISSSLLQIQEQKATRKVEKLVAMRDMKRIILSFVLMMVLFPLVMLSETGFAVNLNPETWFGISIQKINTRWKGEE